MPILRCQRVWFYSPADEAAFFYFLGQIKAVRDIKVAGDELTFAVRKPVSEQSLRDLLGLFKRYSIDMRQLRQLENIRNRTWFRSRSAFWRADVFGTTRKIRAQASIS